MHDECLPPIPAAAPATTSIFPCGSSKRAQGSLENGCAAALRAIAMWRTGHPCPHVAVALIRIVRETPNSVVLDGNLQHAASLLDGAISRCNCLNATATPIQGSHQSRPISPLHDAANIAAGTFSFFGMGAIVVSSCEMRHTFRSATRNFSCATGVAHPSERAVHAVI